MAMKTVYLGEEEIDKVQNDEIMLGEGRWRVADVERDYLGVKE